MLHRGRTAALALSVGGCYAVAAVTGASLLSKDRSAWLVVSAAVAAIGVLSGIVTTLVAVATLRATSDRDPDADIAVTFGTLAGCLFIAVFGFLALRGLGPLAALLLVAVLTLFTHVVLRRGLPRILL